MKTHYPSGLWSERDGSLLRYGKGKKELSIRFSPDDKIQDLPAAYAADVRKAGYQPADFCLCGGRPLARSLIPEIQACIEHAKAQKQAELEASRRFFEDCVASGKAFRVAESTAQYGAFLQWARYAEPGEGYRQGVMFGLADQEQIKVHHQAISRVIGDRKPDGTFPGCQNDAWIISEQEWDRITEESQKIKLELEAARKRFEAEEQADIRMKIDTGFCFSCGTWCHGDCGHYSNDPTTQYRRDAKQAMRESSYGEND